MNFLPRGGYFTLPEFFISFTFFTPPPPPPTVFIILSFRLIREVIPPPLTNFRAYVKFAKLKFTSQISRIIIFAIAGKMSYVVQ